MEKRKDSYPFEELLKQVSTIVKKEAADGATTGNFPCGESSDTNINRQSHYQGEGLDLEEEQRREIHERCEDVVANRGLRKEYASKVFIFMCAWSALVFLIVILDALTYNPPIGVQKDLSFRLSSSVMTTLIGGTTVSVIGLVGFIVKGLFPGTPSEKKSSKE